VAYIEDLDNLEEVEDLTNCSVDENDELDQQIEPKVGMEFDGIEGMSSTENMQRHVDFQLGKISQRRRLRGWLEV